MGEIVCPLAIHLGLIIPDDPHLDYLDRLRTEQRLARHEIADLRVVITVTGGQIMGSEAVR
jgi:hypothetical protein